MSNNMPPQGAARKAAIVLVFSLKPLTRNALRGFCTIALPSGLTIEATALLKGDGQ